MISDPDIFRAAKLVIDQRGEEAATFAAVRADLLLKEGDADGAAIWRRTWRRSRSSSGGRGKTKQ